MIEQAPKDLGRRQADNLDIVREPRLLVTRMQAAEAVLAVEVAAVAVVVVEAVVVEAVV